jgi:hypothetical protein
MVFVSSFAPSTLSGSLLNSEVILIVTALGRLTPIAIGGGGVRPVGIDGLAPAAAVEASASDSTFFWGSMMFF